MLKVLLIGPLPEPTTGVSLANKVVFESFKKTEGYQIDFINTSLDRFDESLGALSLYKIWFYLKLNFFAYKIFTSKIIYLTPGQTFFGVVKYSLFIYLSKLLRKEIIIHVHGNHLGEEYKTLSGIKKKIFKNLLKHTSKGVVLSESLKGNMSPFIEQKKIHVLYNFVEDHLYNIEENTVNEKLKLLKPKIIFLSNLMQEKGVFELLDSLKILEKSNFDYEAKVAGNIDKDSAQRINSYFKELKNTAYIGVVSGDEKRNLLSWGNVFILPTYYKMEGQPISILEAMATGNIIITTNHAGIPDIFSNKKNGFFVRKNDSQHIVDVLKHIVENKETSQKIILENINEAKEKYRVSHFIESIKAIFEA